MPDDEIGWVLWSGTLGLDSPVLDRIPAAASAGYQYLSVSPLDLQRLGAEGVPPAELRRRTEDEGLRLIMDPVMRWHPFERPSKSDFARVTLDEALRGCEALGVETMSAMAGTTSAVPTDGLAEGFAELCDRARDIGALVHLEFIPMTVVPDLATAWEVVRLADRDNGGVLFDTWHFFRGNPDFELLDQVPGQRIFAVQVDDAAAEVAGHLWEDTMHRLMPGDGSFDLRRALGVLARIGGLNRVGPEVISPETEAMAPAEAASVAGERVRTLVAEAKGAVR